MEEAPYAVLVEDFFSEPVPCASCGRTLHLDETAVMHPDSTVVCEDGFPEDDTLDTHHSCLEAMPGTRTIERGGDAADATLHPDR